MSEAMPIGGFFGLEPASASAPDGASVLDRWTAGAPGWLGFHNARSAFAHLIRRLDPATVWLPCYLCRDMDVAGARARYYGSGDDPALRSELADGDLVLTLAAFGAPVAEGLRRLASARPAVTWVEDRAQALAVPDALAVPCAWRLYSPRKLIGVGDGGLLVGPVARLGTPDLAEPPARHLAAAEARAEARDAAQVGAAYRRYVEIERDHTVSDLAMADATREILARLPLDPLALRRRANFEILDARLADHAAPLAIDLRRAEAPFGYPLVIERDRDGVAARLAADDMFCAVHWRELVRGGAEDAGAQARAARLLTLPVDHRYGAAEMTRLAERVLREVA